VCDSDTENEETLMSSQSRRAAVTVGLDDIADEDSGDDFEAATSKPRLRTTAVAARDKAKYYILSVCSFTL